LARMSAADARSVLGEWFVMATSKIIETLL